MFASLCSGLGLVGKSLANERLLVLKDCHPFCRRHSFVSVLAVLAAMLIVYQMKTHTHLFESQGELPPIVLVVFIAECL